jgi:hypothetical protein
MKLNIILAVSAVSMALFTVGCGTQGYDVRGGRWIGPTPPPTPTCCCTPTFAPQPPPAPAPQVAPPVYRNPQPRVYRNPCDPPKKVGFKIFSSEAAQMNGLRDIGGSELPATTVARSYSETDLHPFVDFRKVEAEGTIIDHARLVDFENRTVETVSHAEPYKYVKSRRRMCYQAHTSQGTAGCLRSVAPVGTLEVAHGTVVVSDTSAVQWGIPPFTPDVLDKSSVPANNLVGFTHIRVYSHSEARCMCVHRVLVFML